MTAGGSPRIRFADLLAVNRDVRSALDAAFSAVMDSGWYVLGPAVEEFERAFAEFVGVDHCVGVASGLDALSIALIAVGVEPGDEVIVPSHTYIATWLAVTHVGAIPVPVEPEPDLLNMDPRRIEAAITSQTRAILPVHLYGHPAEMDPIMQLAKDRQLVVVEDAAQSHGALYRGRTTGSTGHAAAFSFYPTKNLGAFGDAGAVTTDDPAVANRVRLLRNYGSEQRYVNRVVGRNSRLDELQARLLSVKLPNLPRWNSARQQQASLYLRELADADVTLPVQRPWAEHVWHLFVIRSPRRDELVASLEKAGIETLIHYPIAPHLQEAYSSLGYEKGMFPVAEKAQDEVLSLPMGPHLTDTDVVDVAAAVRGVVGSR